MVEFESILKPILKEREARTQRLLQILRAPDDLVSLVLRGHLFIEELLFAAVSARCHDTEQVKRAQLRFPQFVALLRALEKNSVAPPNCWTALSELNSLRNALDQNLEPNDLASRVARIVAAVAEGSVSMKFPETRSSRKALEAGALELQRALLASATEPNWWEPLITEL